MLKRTASFALLVLLIAACGGQPEQVVVPTLANVEPSPTAANPDAPTLAPATPVPQLPTPIPVDERDIAPRIEGLQIAAASAGGAFEEGFPANDLFVINAGGSTFRITTDPSNESSPEWATDGNRLYYTADFEGTPFIYVINVNNQNPVQRLAPFDANEQREPSLSPDGLNLVFTSNRGGADAIYRMSAVDGRGVQQLTINPTRDYHPDWSPDNTWIAFTSERDGNPEIYIMDTQGGQAKRLTDAPGVDHQPAVSPDGRRIAFISDRSGTPEVWVMGLPQVPLSFDEQINQQPVDVRTGIVPPLPLDATAPIPDVIRITADGTPKTAPAWVTNPDGSIDLVYVALSGERGQVFLVNEDGSGGTPITDPALSFTDPAPRPFGGR